MCMPTNFGTKKDKSYIIRDKKKKKSDFDDEFFKDDFLKDKKSETSNIKS
jgi:hypothetical protein